MLVSPALLCSCALVEVFGVDTLVALRSLLRTQSRRLNVTSPLELLVVSLVEMLAGVPPDGVVELVPLPRM
jgi:hypothetical protein